MHIHPPPRGHLAKCELCCEKQAKGSWYILSRGQGCCSTLYNTEESPSTIKIIFPKMLVVQSWETLFCIYVLAGCVFCGTLGFLFVCLCFRLFSFHVFVLSGFLQGQSQWSLGSQTLFWLVHKPDLLELENRKCYTSCKGKYSWNPLTW